ncbi:hypothetical protein JW752_05100 [Candidatus Peregrinibacteria bacterium]|nr:hypothetical protein [Candidatus Peregrinibacteria bacterium]
MKALHRVLRDKPLPPLIFGLFCLAMFWALTVPVIIHKVAANPIYNPLILAFALTGTATLLIPCWHRRRLCLATAMSCDRGADKKKDLLFVTDTSDTADGILGEAQRFELLKKGFQAAKIIGHEDAMLDECRHRYGHRPDMMKLVLKAFGETCSSK